MFKSDIENIKKCINIRESLLSVKNLIRDGSIKRKLAYFLEGDYGIFVDLLKDADPKTRRNAALILGELEDEEVLPALFEAYSEESTLYVRADMLSAMSAYDCGEYINRLKDREEELYKLLSSDGENAKHYDNELRCLRQLLYTKDSCIHRFTGKAVKTGIYLSAYPECVDILAGQLKAMGKRISVKGAGVTVFDTCVDELKDLRIYRELMLPVIEDGRLADPDSLLNDISSSALVSILRNSFDGEAPFTYRMQIKGMGEEKSRELAKSLPARLDKVLPLELVNSPTDYQIELRLVFRAEGMYSLYLKSGMITDDRFNYRVKSTSEAMKPVLAAVINEYCSKYFKEKSVVLDCFCGSGILLVERLLRTPVSKALAIDSFDLAAEAAKLNTAKAGLKVAIICKNFFSFDTDGLTVDEIITDLPRATAKKDVKYIAKLYKNFLEKAEAVVKKGGYLFLYTNAAEALEAAVSSHSYTRIDKRLIRKKDDSYLIILQRV